MELADANEILTRPSWRDEVETLSPTRVRVATLDHLDGIAPPMLSWWFGNMDADRYRRFHPCDHKKFAWTRGKRPGEFVGATHLTYHQYGGGDAPVNRSEISFIDAREHLDPSLFGPNNVEMALVAYVHLVDEEDHPLPEEAGRFMHIAMRRDYGTELRSCWWLEVEPTTDFELITTGRLRHVHEEFGYLQGFLRGLYNGDRAPGE